MRRTLFIVPIILSSLFFAGVAGNADAKSVIDTVRGLFIVEKGLKGSPVWYVWSEKQVKKQDQKPKRYCVTKACDPKDGEKKAPCYFIDASRKDLDRIPRPGERARRVASKFLGRILPDAVNEEEAWYVDPRSKKRYPVGSPDGEALRIMRARAKQLTKKELASIPMGKDCAKSTTQQSIPPPKLPGIPYLTAINAPACESIEIQWGKVTDAEAYQIFRDDVSLATVNVDTFSFRDTGLKDQHPYTYKVRSLNAAGASLFSSEEGLQPQRCVLPPPPPTRQAPQTPASTSLYIGSTCSELVFRWSDVVDEDGYDIYRDGLLHSTVHPNVTTLVIPTSPRGAQYRFKVRAVNAVGASAFTPEKLSPLIQCGATPPMPPPTPPKPAIPDIPHNFSGSPQNCNHVLLSWTDLANEESYEVFRDNNLIAAVPANTTNTIDTQAKENTMHRYSLRSRNAIGVSGMSNLAIVTTPACAFLPAPLPPPGQPPATPQFTHVTSVDCRTFVLHWTDVSGEDGYRIYRDGMLITNTSANILEFTDASLAPEFHYRYVIRSFNNAGDSPSSSVVSFKTGKCTTIPVQAAPSQIRINGTAAACAARGGTTCGVSEICPTRWFDVSGDNRCCATACQSFRITDRCNANSVCETFESAACGDCQCRGGVVCGGLCYAGIADEAACVRETLVPITAASPGQGTVYCADAQQCSPTATCLVPGPCLEWNLPLKVIVDLPRQLEKDVWTQGTIIFTTDRTMASGYKVYFTLKNMDLELLQSGGTTIPFPTEWDAAQFQSNIPVTYQVRARSRVVSKTYAQDRLEEASLGFDFAMSTTPFFTRTFRGVERPQAQQCGSYLWNVSGVCLGSIFYPGASCASGNDCFGRIQGWGSYRATYAPKGTYAVLFVTTDLNASQQTTFNQQKFMDIGDEVRAFYLREAERIAGKPLVDFTLTFGGHFQWNLPDTEFKFLNGHQTIRDYLQSKMPQLQLANYHFIIIGVPRITGGAAVGAAGGWYLGNGVIDLRIPDVLSPMTVAHELGHGFGCRDIWTANAANSFFLCNERRVNNLYCSGTQLIPELLALPKTANGMYTLSSLRLDDCAGEMKWGDIDNDGIIDIEDPSIP